MIVLAQVSALHIPQLQQRLHHWFLKVNRPSDLVTQLFYHAPLTSHSYKLIAIQFSFCVWIFVVDSLDTDILVVFHLS